MIMNENIDLTKILKDCPKWTKLYSRVHGEVDLINSNAGLSYPIVVRLNNNKEEGFTAKGKLLIDYDDSECILVPSKDQQDWTKFSAPLYKKEKFDPKTLQPFDKVLVRDSNFVTDSPSSLWKCQILSFIREDEDYPYKCIEESYSFCIPYNDETKHLVGTSDAAPEFYRYWEYC